MKLSGNPRILYINKWDKCISYVWYCRNAFSSSTQPKLKDKEKWNSVVGLEIHAQIASKSKLFSGADTSFAKPVNTCVSFFDCATPGTLPVLNKRCVEAAVSTSLALSCKLNEVSLFDRKHYFYADLPAGYQITQQRQPLAVDGELKFRVFTPGVHKKAYVKLSKIKQIQLEQDSGKSLHDELERRSLVDLNRAGIPLMEFVFEPDLTDGEEAAALVKELSIILERLGTCSCKMEEGAIRVDANISVNKPGKPLGIRTEIKNIGSVRNVATAVRYEIERQILELEAGGVIVNETRAWNDEKGMTVPMRDKEEKQDYRFMPEPNLPPLHLHMDESIENKYDLVNVPLLKSQLPELPEAIRVKLQENFGLSSETAIIIVNELVLLQYFINIMKENNKRSAKRVTNILITDLLTSLNNKNIQLNSCLIPYQHIGEVVDLLENRNINITVARQILDILIDDSESSPRQIVERNEWFQITDETELIKLCQSVIDDNPELVKKYKNGKKKLLKAFLGQVASRSERRADMEQVTKIMERLLST
ncbi:glutamyl-tRNA(Gln) amidotransferase subunit B, mitochondrial isoform X2 [Cephus cinctus]|uniref:Glutamyl-tRNA(Gln) amidotransferase subunit B, mitochondrial n=1 Tax=Cephus cinctus TaxID=211228 RepID=A0AAJ7FLZ7_CEPCN|nr:glutamyl-tRNA(Gln) amidotransferase subunit B, mitochondrial isoform X2 [Cephus cinctus]